MLSLCWCWAQVLRAHVLPLTNCAYNKSGDRFITASYDRTCKVRSTPTYPPNLSRRAASTHAQPGTCWLACTQVWDTHTGQELHTLEGHKNVVSWLSLRSSDGAVELQHACLYAVVDHGPSIELCFAVIRCTPLPSTTRTVTRWQRAALTKQQGCGTSSQAAAVTS